MSVCVFLVFLPEISVYSCKMYFTDLLISILIYTFFGIITLVNNQNQFFKIEVMFMYFSRYSAISFCVFHCFKYLFVCIA